MNLDVLRTKLLAAARRNPPSDTVPYAFEKRIMARLTALPSPDLWTEWGKAMWRAAVSCVALTLLLSLWAIYFSAPAFNSETSLADLESTVLAPIHAENEIW